MNIFDLVFMACFLSAIGYGGWIVSLLVRGRWPDVRRHTLRLGTAVGVYVVVVVLAGLSSSRRVLAANELLRYDDWCLGVEHSTFVDAIGPDTRAEPGRRFLVVTLKVMNTAARVRQAAPQGSLVYVLDENDARYDVSERGQRAFAAANGDQPDLALKLDPQGVFRTVRVFDVPTAAKGLSLAHRHGSGFPGILIIGEGFRKPATIPLEIGS